MKPDLAELERRLEAVEVGLAAMPPRLCYIGDWEPGFVYAAGALVTRSGSVWHCNERTVKQPGEGDAWTLFCRRGEDGRNGRDGKDAAALWNYRGVWQAGEEYERGAIVTDRGSVFHCNDKAGADVRPGESLSWTLICKRGRDGKDAV